MANQLRYVCELYVGDFDPVAGDQLNELFGNFQVGDIYVSRQTGKVYVRNTNCGNVNDWVLQSGILAVIISNDDGSFVNFEPE